MTTDGYPNRSYGCQVLPLVLVLFALVVPATCLSFELLVGTDEAGSFSYFAGKAVCRAINKVDNDLTCRPVPSGHYTDKLTNVVNGSLDMALVNSKIIHDAFHGAGLFQFVSLDYSRLRLLMPMYRMPVTLLVRRDANISSAEDLVGKKVNGGAPSSLQALVFNEIMAVAGWHKDSFRPFQRLPEANGQDFIALHSGSVDAMIHVGMHPAGRIEHSLASKSTEMIGVAGHLGDRLLDNNAGFFSHSIPPGTYPGRGQNIDTLALETFLIASAEADSDTVEKVLDAVFSAKKRLQYAHPSLLKERIDVETLNDSYLHPHPEAILFFQSNQDRL